MYFPLLIGIFCIGLLIGISGIGGFLLPALLIILDITPVEAVAIGLGAQILIYFASFLLYLRRGQISFRSSFTIIPGAIPGVFLGLLININIPQRVLTLVLAAVLAMLLLVINIQKRYETKAIEKNPCSPQENTSLGHENASKCVEAEKNNPIRKRIALVGAGFLAGSMASLAGVGGPVITVPFLMAMRYESAESVGTSIFSGTFIVGAAFIFHMYVQDFAPGLAAAVGLFAALGAVVGAALQGKVGKETGSSLITGITMLSILYLIFLA